MSRRLSFALGLGSILVCSAFAAPFLEDLFKPAEHESLGKQLALYFEAYSKNSGTDKALEKVSDEVKKLEKRLNKSPLSLPGDLGKALWASFDYDKKANALKKGSVKDMTCPKPLVEDDPKAVMNYALWVPAKYDPRKAYPLILLVPDRDQKPAQHITEKWTDAAIRDSAILAAVGMPEDTNAWTEPATKLEDGKIKDGGLSNMLAVLVDVRKGVAIDFDRVYVCGSGEGVRAACAMAARFPDNLAGVAGRSGDVPEKIAIEPFRNLPSLFAGAGSGATAFSERLTKEKYDNCTIKPEAKEADLWAWMQDHPRISNPTQVVLVAEPNTQARSYWIQTPRFDAPVRLTATADRGTNTITIDADGATEVTISLNDQLVDLDKEIKFIRNGTETVEKVPRNLTTTLGAMRSRSSDPGRIYVATKRCDIPPKPKPKDKPKDK